MSNNPDNEKFNNLLNQLKQKNEKRRLNIWIPSLSRGVEFKHLTIEQQKRLIKSSLRENLLKLDFSRNIYDIIVENNTDPEVDVTKLNVIDMISIGLTYRSTDIDENYGFYYNQDFFPVDLNKVCEKIRTIDTSKLKSTTIVSDNYHLHINVPTIQVDKIMNDELYLKYKDIPDDADMAKEMLTDLYMYEAAKYIKQVDIVSEGDNPDEPPVSVDFTNFTATQRLQAIAEIPLDRLNKLVSLSEVVQDTENKILEVELSETQTAKIEINSAFFT